MWLTMPHKIESVEVYGRDMKSIFRANITMANTWQYFFEGS